MAAALRGLRRLGSALASLPTLALTLGPRWLLYRVKRELALRSGAYALASPQRQWSEVNDSAHPLGSFPLLDDEQRPLLPPACTSSESDASLAEAEAVLQGRYRLFSWAVLDLGNPPDWHRDPWSKRRWPSAGHWSRHELFRRGDVKACWELSRFGWAYCLASARRTTGQDRFGRAFWDLFENWCRTNPPNTGIHWHCGQEASLRLFAVVYAGSVLWSDANPGQRSLWSKFVTQTAERVRAHIDYALSQSNNHGVSECIGLLTAALCLGGPSHQPGHNQELLEFALRQLEAQLCALVYADGGFAQHSLVYQRLVVDELVWAVALLHAAAVPVPGWLWHALGKTAAFLSVLVDPKTGGAPLFGANDGSLLFPWCGLEARDCRKLLDTSARLLATLGHDASAFAALPEGPLRLLPARLGQAVHAVEAGVLSWRHADFFVSLRCPTLFRHRPAQSDALHADVWWRGSPLALDAGSYSYNAPPPFDTALSDAQYHNLPMLFGQEPMKRISRFLFAPWPRGSARFDVEGQSFSASHDAYRARGASVTRRVRALDAGGFELRDEFTAQTSALVSVHWLLSDLQWRLGQSEIVAELGSERVHLSWSQEGLAEVSVERASSNSARGWQAPHYLQRVPAVSVRLVYRVWERLAVTSTFHAEQG